MENLGEALKIGFAIAFFVMALSLSISSFSQANEAVRTITSARDRDVQMEIAQMNLGGEQYVYLEPSPTRTRIVGVDSIVTTLNRAIDEDIELRFLDEAGNPFNVIKYKNDVGGIEESHIINASKLNDSDVGDKTKEFVIYLLAGDYASIETSDHDSSFWNDFKHKNSYKILHTDGLYNELLNYNNGFEEIIGEYYESSGASEVKHVIITYQIHP